MIALFVAVQLLLQSSSSLVAAQTEQQQLFQHPLTDMPDAARDVSTSFYFTPEESDGQRMPIGKTVTVLCHFSNNGDFPYNVTAIMGSLNSPYDFGYYIQNYTYKPVGLVVRSGEEATLEYQFQVHPDLQPSAYQLAHTVFYEDDSVAYSTTFFNETVELVFSDSEGVDADTVLQLAFSVFLTLAVAFAVLIVCLPAKKQAAVVQQLFAKKVESKNDNWIDETR